METTMGTAGMGSAPVRVAGVEDDLSMLEWIEKVVRRDARMQWMGGWQTGEEAGAALRELPVDVLVLDLVLPEMTGAECCRQVLKLSPRTRVLALSGHDDGKLVRAAFAAGMTGYLLKPVSVAKLRQTILETANGDRVLSPKVLDVVLEQFNPRDGRNGHGCGLTPREQEVMQGVARGLGNKEIAVGLGIGENTVGEHLKNIFRKLGVHSRAAAVARVGVKHGGM